MTRNEAHPITVEVVRNAIVAYADEMANALSKAAYNMMIYEVRDYCCGLIDTQARMISQNCGGLPIFLADLGVAVADGIERYGLKGFSPGDVIIMNQGEVCGQHLNNVVLYSPCFHNDELVGFAANRAHWVDIGGVRQGFGSYGSSDIYAEGIQMRSLKIYEAGKRNETLWQIIRDNTRYPDSALGDMRAQIASCQLGARRYGELIARYGRETVEACIAKVWDQAEASARAVIEDIPDGDYEAESLLDNDGRTLDKPLRVKVKVRVRGSQMTVDFSEMPPQNQGPLNSGRGGGIAGARVAFKALTSPDLDVNEGCFRPLEVVLPEGTMLSAKPPSALGLWSIALPTVIDTILKALAPAVPHLIPAAHKGDMGGCSFFGFRDDGSRFLLMNIFGGGWGGRPNEDGEDAAVSVCQGDVRNTPVELQEIKYPVLVETHALRPDFGGAGQHRGGLGVELTYQLLQKCKANINLDRTRDPPWGLHGGKAGAVNECYIHRVDGAETAVKKATEIDIAAGDKVVFLTAGGGGYGDPAKRDPQAIAQDVAAGVVTGESSAMIADERRKRLTDAMQESGLDVLLVYGNAWQGDYLRYATDFGILEGQALAIVRGDGHVTLYVDSPLEADRAALDCPGIETVLAPDLVGEVDAALNRMRNQSVGAAPQRLLPRKIAARAAEFKITDETGFVDRLLMNKLDSEIAAIRKSAKLADEGYKVFMQAARVGRADYELIAEAEAFFRAHGVDDNFQIIGVGGVEVKGMAPPNGKKLKRGDMVTTELTPCVDGYYAQICRTLVVGEATSEQKGAHALWRESMEAGIATVRDGVTAADIAKAENDVFRKYGMGKYTTSEFTRVRGHGMGLFADTKPHILEDVTTRIDAGMALIVHPNTYHPVVGYMVLGDGVAVTKDGCEVLTGTARELFSVAA